MGIAFNAVYLITRTVSQSERTVDRDVLTLGVQDCYFTRDSIECFLRRHQIPFTQIRDDQVEHTSGFRHLGPADRERLAQNIHQRTLFQLLGYARSKVRSMDISDFEGCDIVHDLNEPVASTLHDRFDLIVDAGTIEHVFSLKDAFFNVARMCRIDGMVIHFAPVDMVNHGFVNLNSYVFEDFYRTNGFERVCLRYIAIPNEPGKEETHFLDINPFLLREPLRAPYYLAVFAAYRKVASVDLKVPVQGFYNELLGLGPTDRAGADHDLVMIGNETSSRSGGLVQSAVERFRRAVSRISGQQGRALSPALPPHARVEL